MAKRPHISQDRQVRALTAQGAVYQPASKNGKGLRIPGPPDRPQVVDVSLDSASTRAAMRRPRSGHRLRLHDPQRVGAARRAIDALCRRETARPVQELHHQLHAQVAINAMKCTYRLGRKTAM